MAIVPKFTSNQITVMMAQRLKKIELAIISRLQNVGERFVANARSVNSYQDQTGNLRSSIGYVILEDGKQLAENLYGNNTGVATARQAIQEAKSKYPTGYVLIVVAGMDYAAAVEANGYDVLTASSIQAESDLKKAIADLSKKATTI